MGIDVRIYDDKGTPAYQIGDFFRLEAVRVLGDVGGCRLSIPEGKYKVGDFRRDMMIAFTYEVSGFGTSWVFLLRELGRIPGMILLDGDSPLCIAEDRIVAYPAHTAQTEKTDQADDIMRAVMRENLGASATSSRDRSSYLTIGGDLAQGPNVSKSFAWQSVLTVLQDLRGQALIKGTKIYFDLVPVFSGQNVRFRFDTYLNQPGVDRTTGSQKLVFSEERGNLIDPSVWYTWRQRPTYAYALGQGEGEDRTQQEAAATGASDSVWARVETYVDARMSETDAAVLAEAERELASRGPIVRFEGGAVDTDGSRFAVDWNFGDRVIAEYNETEYECLIDTVHIDLQAGEPIAVSARLVYEGLIGS